MGKIYISQSSLKVRLDTEEDITGATATKIKYQKPDETEGEWNASVEDAALGIIFYELSTAELDQTGCWLFWAHVTFADGRHAPGEPIRETIYAEPG